MKYCKFPSFLFGLNYFRFSSSCKVVVGRNKDENEKLLSLTGKDDISFWPEEINGPVGVGRGDFDQARINLASQIVARYSDNSNLDKVKVLIEDSRRKKINSLVVNSMTDDQLQAFRI